MCVEVCTHSASDTAGWKLTARSFLSVRVLIATPTDDPNFSFLNSSINHGTESSPSSCLSVSFPRAGHLLFGKTVSLKILRFHCVMQTRAPKKPAEPRVEPSALNRPIAHRAEPATGFICSLYYFTLARTKGATTKGPGWVGCAGLSCGVELGWAGMGWAGRRRQR